jgi:rRNA maturation protein Nop10
MSIIKCPECKGRVSTMAGTCPHCGIHISGQLRHCPHCNEYCLQTQDTCPECGEKLEPIPVVTAEKDEIVVDKASSNEPKKKKSYKSIGWTCIFALISSFFAFAGYYYYTTEQMRQKEQSDYERLANMTDPKTFRQFLDDYPESQHFDEVNERMLALQAEAEEWQRLLQNVNRAALARFVQKYPTTLRKRACEDMLDSIDWQEAVAVGNENAITDYLARHPFGRYTSEAAEIKNALLLSKVTLAERTMIRGTLESFFAKVIANQDIEAARAAIPDSMINFCGKDNADAEAIIQYANEKKEKDVIGLHYVIAQQMSVRKETLHDGSIGYSAEFNLQETISRSDTKQPMSNIYRVSALVNQEQKIVRMSISK